MERTKDEPIKCGEGIVLLNSITYQYELVWQDLIFLPFNGIVETAFIVHLLVSNITYIYLLTFDPMIEEGGWFDNMLMILEVTYCIHTVLLLCHKCFKKHRKRRYYHSHSWFLLAIDCISMIPLGYFNSFSMYFQWTPTYSAFFEYYTHILKLLRIIRLVCRTKEYQVSPNANNLFLVSVFHFIFVIVASGIFTMFFFHMCCLECHHDNLMRYMSFIYFDDTDNVSWAALLFSYVYLLISHNYWGILVNATHFEIILSIFCMVIGVILRYIFLMGNMTTYYVHLWRNMFWYKQEHIWANRLMHIMQFDKELIEKINLYYNTIWTDYTGVVQLPSIFKVLPLAMQREVLTDIYWDAMMHSHVYRAYPAALKREVASQMETVVCMPGQAIFTIGELKSAMWYLSNGVVQLMSTENNSAPIMSFKSGTVFGMISCTLPTVSNGTFVCRTKCHFHTLNYTSMYVLYRSMSGFQREMMESIRQRIRFAKIKRLYLKNYNINVDASHIGWIKKQWRVIAGVSTNTDDGHDLNNECYSSRFLDLIVLSTGQEWQSDLICVRKDCPLIMKAESSFRRFLHYLNLCVIILHFALVFEAIAFENAISSDLAVVLYVLDLFYFLDLYVELSTMPKGFNTTNPTEIFFHHIRSWLFIVDIIATVPYDYFSEAFQISDLSKACMRAPRFLKLYKLVQHAQEMEFTASITKLNIILWMKFIVLHIVFILICVIIFYISTCPVKSCPDSWLSLSKEQDSLQTDVTNTNEYLDYVKLFHHTMSVYLSLKISNEIEVNISEVVILTVVAMLGFYVCAHAFTQFAAVCNLQHEFKHLFLLNIDILNEVTNRKDLRHLKTKIIDFANFQWNLNKNSSLTDIWRVMGQESESIRKLVTEEYVMRSLRSTTLFRECDARFLWHIAENSRMMLIPPGHEIFDANYRIFHLYLIVEGTCQYHSLLSCDMDKDIENYIEKHECFPVLDMFHGIKPLIRVKSVTTVILLCIPYLAIRQLFKAFPVEGKIMRTTCEIHFKANSSFLKNSGILEVNKKNDTVKVPTFTYNTKYTCENMSFFHGLSRWERWFDAIKHNTYDPRERGYITYEIFRCTCIILQVFLALISAVPSVYKCFNGACQVIEVCFFFLAVADFYIRSHVQYYNDIGIKVTKASHTFTNYMKHSFTLDLISMFPYDTLGFVGIISWNKMRAFLITMLAFRSLSLYRPVHLFLYFKGNVNPKYEIYFVLFGAAVIWMYFAASTTQIYYVLTYDTSNDRFDTFEHSWVTLHTSLESITSPYLIIFYVISSMGVTAVYSVFFIKSMILELMTMVYIFVVKLAINTYLVGSLSLGNVRTAYHQDNIRDYYSFTSNRMVSNRDKEEVIEHVGNYWKKSNGTSLRTMFENFPLLMREEIFLSLYKLGLRYCHFFFDSQEDLYRLILPDVEEMYFKKDADIVRTNDIQDNVYIVLKGTVHVYIANIYICTLRVGGTFGSFYPRGYVRQTIKVKAAVHVKILRMKTTYLYEIGNIYQTVYARLKNLYLQRIEYIKEVEIDHFRETNRSIESSSSGNFEKRTINTTKSRYYMSWYFVTFYEGNSLVRIWNYIANVHVACLSTIYCLYVVAVKEGIDDIWLWILLDMFFFFQMYLRMHTSYTDLETGVTVRLYQKIARKYMKSMRFFIDVINLVPLYAIAIFIPYQRKSILLLNKLSRVYDTYDYYHYYVIRKNVPRHLQWTFLIYNTMIALQVVFDVWYAVSDYPDDVAVIKSYQRVIVVYTMTGMHEPDLSTSDQLVVNLLLIYVSQTLLIHMLIVITRLLNEYNISFGVFKIALSILTRQCRNENLSKPLHSRILTYLTYLFRYHNGKQVPTLLQTAPAYIIQDHNTALHSKYIEAHYPFSDAHIDFMRQLYQVVEVNIYMPNDMIVEAGDCNSTMYFIEYGEVIGIEGTGDDISCVFLKEGVFGMRQGLVNVEHTITYRALTKCSVISVCRHKWDYLLGFFPATQDIINQVIADNDSLHSSDFSTISGSIGGWNDAYEKAPPTDSLTKLE